MVGIPAHLASDPCESNDRCTGLGLRFWRADGTDHARYGGRSWRIDDTSDLNLDGSLNFADHFLDDSDLHVDLDLAGYLDLDLAVNRDLASYLDLTVYLHLARHLDFHFASASHNSERSDSHRCQAEPSPSISIVQYATSVVSCVYQAVNPHRASMRAQLFTVNSALL